MLKVDGFIHRFTRLVEMNSGISWFLSFIFLNQFDFSFSKTHHNLKQREIHVKNQPKFQRF